MSLYSINEISPYIKLGIWKVDESIDSLRVLAELDSGEEIKFNRFASNQRKMHWLASRALLNNVFSKKTTIEYSSKGKPQIKDSNSHISISHSGVFVTVLINENFSCGVDIERFSDRIDRISHKFLHKQELEYIKNGERNDFLSIIWSAKETLFKLHGEGELIFSENLLVHKFTPAKKGKISGSILIDNCSLNFNLWYEKISEYILVYSV